MHCALTSAKYKLLSKVFILKALFESCCDGVLSKLYLQTSRLSRRSAELGKKLLQGRQKKDASKDLVSSRKALS